MKLKGKYVGGVVFAMLALLLGALLLIAPALQREGRHERFFYSTIIPGDITRIEHQGATALRVAPGEWRITLSGSETEWRGSAAAIRAVLRAAADITMLAPAGGADSVPTNVITFSTGDGQSSTLALADATIGGMRSVVIDNDTTFRAPATLVEKLLPGPLAWRDASLFPNAGPNVTRVLIRQPATDADPAREIDLTKTAGRWIIASPVLARASEEAMRSAIGRIASSSIVRFLDTPPADLTSGLDAPDFVITVESGDDAGRIAFGAHADAAGAHRFATTGAGHFFIADTSLLRELRLDPAAYTDRRASPVALPDVHAIRVNSASAQRTLTGWTDAPFDPAAILDALTNQPSQLVAFDEPAGWINIATITLEDLAGDPLDIVLIGQDGAGTLHARTQLPGGGPAYYALPPSFRAALE